MAETPNNADATLSVIKREVATKLTGRFGLETITHLIL